MRKTNVKGWIGIGVLLLTMFNSMLFANQLENTQGIFDLMLQPDAIEVSLELDMAEVMTLKRKEDELKAKFSFTDIHGEAQQWNIKVGARGKFRRMRCEGIPPLKLNFKKSDLRDAGLAAFDDFKLVPQCLEDEKAAQEYLMKEYLAYKIFNRISDFSFRVQMLKITYIDANSGEKTKQYGFLIEDTAQLRARIGGEKCKDCVNLSLDQYNLKEANRVSAFQYLIGNSDWNFATEKNVKLIKIDGKVIPVPYDFDFTGIVGASYSSVDTGLGIRTVYDRVYLGPDAWLNSNELDEAVSELITIQEELIDLVSKEKLLSRSQRNDAKAYLNTFFEAPVIVLTAAQRIDKTQEKELQSTEK